MMVDAVSAQVFIATKPNPTRSSSPINEPEDPQKDAQKAAQANQARQSAVLNRVSTEYYVEALTSTGTEEDEGEEFNNNPIDVVNSSETYKNNALAAYGKAQALDTRSPT